MRFVLAACLAASIFVPNAAAADHACADDARKRAAALLTLHFNDGEAGPIENMSIADEVKALAPIKAMKGKGKFDVLEVWGYIYKGEYRMRFIYAQIPDTCLLMGQEILEQADPY